MMEKFHLFFSCPKLRFKKSIATIMRYVTPAKTHLAVEPMEHQILIKTTFNKTNEMSGESALIFIGAEFCRRKVWDDWCHILNIKEFAIAVKLFQRILTGFKFMLCLISDFHTPNSGITPNI